ncbi:MAG: hypothetical protein JSU69_00100 [Candidatus Zixiibacteriota bacterium]|nr:MAG: hypothetical protein JSU69_00100 [candidate division Zixibacteria bacterium]
MGSKLRGDSWRVNRVCSAGKDSYVIKFEEIQSYICSDANGDGNVIALYKNGPDPCANYR